MFVDREHLVIPDCISSKYEINRTPEETSNDQNRGKFLVSILTTSAWDTGFLCPYNTLAVRFTGSEFDDNAGQWKKIIIDVRSSGGKQVILKLFGVNALMSSANPCNEGSAGGTIQCGLFAANAAYRMLALQVESTLDEPRAGRPYFKLPRFYEHAERYCERANRSIGSGSWPTAHVSGCLETILERKVREFIAWRACKDEHRPGDKRVCKVPTENFDTHGTVGP